MNTEQKRFYRFWLSQWHSGNALPLDGQVSYAFCYLYSVLRFSARQAAGVLERMYSAYPDEGPLTLYVRLWLSDCYVLEGRYVEALGVFPEPALDNCVSYMTNKRLNLKLLAGDRISGCEALALLGTKIAAFEKETLQQIAEYLGIRLRALEADKGINLLRAWARDAYKTRYEVFTGSLGAMEIDLPFYHFSAQERAVQEIHSLMREAENTIREENRLPGVGEAWVAETELCHKLKKFFSDEPVLYHSRPEWLERQHLDILLPKRGVAIEYQGLQDDQGIEFFGGDAALRLNRRRDAEKKSLCEAHGLRLVEVRPGYNLDCVIAEVMRCSRTARP